MSTNSEKMSKVIDLLTESLSELKAISSHSGEYSREQVERLVRYAYLRGQRDLVSSVNGESYDTEIDTYAGDLCISGTLEVRMPHKNWFEDYIVGIEESSTIDAVITDGLESDV